MEKIKSCTKCGAEMEEGSPKYAGIGFQTWLKKGKHTTFGASNIKFYSCLKCGYIESYVDRNSDP